MFRFLLLFLLSFLCFAAFGAEGAPEAAKMSVFQWIAENYVNVFAAIGALIGLGEIITRFTPTKKDDGFMERVGAFFRKAMDVLKIPNNVKK